MFIEALSYLDSDFHELSEREFIVDKQRAGTLLEHFPFLKDTKKFKNIVIRNNAGKVIGGLVIKITHDNDHLIGCIGLVVVAKEARGQGYSKLLLKKAIEECQKEEMDYLLLWTSLHAFYAQFGFVTDEPLTYLELNEQGKVKGLKEELTADFESQPTYTKNQGRLICGFTSVRYLHDGSGYIFVGYEGDVATAADMVAHKFGSTNKPRVIIPSNDPLVTELQNKQPALIQHNYKYEMCLPLKNDMRSKKIFDFSQRI